MSYILDALKKDRSNKGQNTVPDLSSEHAQYEFEEEKALSRWVWPIVVMLLVLTVGVLVFMLLNPSAQQTTKNIAQAVKPTQENKPVETGSSIQITTQANKNSIQAASTAMVTAKPLAVGKPVVERVVRKNQAVKNDSVKDDSVKDDVKGKSTAGASSSITLSKQDLPTIIYTTHIYATQSKDRFVMLNGKAYSQGDTVSTGAASGLVIKEILENDLVVVYKGQEFVLPSLEDVNAN